MSGTSPTMIPKLEPELTIDAGYREFMTRLADAGFAGDIDYRYAARLVVATDNSAFQQMPQGVLFPRDEDDIARVFTLLSEPAFHALSIAPRGGGTSTIGCALTQGLVLDCSRHMNHIVELDTEAGWVRVQPGVVLDALNDYLAEYDLFFAPNVAPSSRATLGGMANTDGCGRGSRVYGKTSDHVLATRLVLADGSRWAAAPCNRETLAEIQARDDLAGAIHREVAAVVTENADEIARVFPKLSRYLSGYNLAQIYAGHDHSRGYFNLNKLICGSEGTLAVVSELTLAVTPIPKAQTLFAMRYDSFDDALADATRLLAFAPTAIESVDDKVMGLARDNPIYARVRDYIENADGTTPAAVNLVAFSAADSDQLDAAVGQLQSTLDDKSDGTATGYYRAQNPEAIAALWDLRKAGVGLLGSTPSVRKPLPFVEDTVVDPSVLPDYIRDFRAILDEYGLEYGMFGHSDVGCLHVRPALNLCDGDDERLMREVTDRVETLVRGYGGLLWNEHGKGFRSEYNPDYFGAALYAALGRVKKAFDPFFQINPGKIVAPENRDVPLAAMDATTRGHYDRQIGASERAAFATTIDCNGNGACFNYDPRDIMCPSYRVTRDRLHSPKGRAAVMREWLRQLARFGFEPSQQATASPKPLWLAAARDALPTNRPKGAAKDFSHEVWTAMDGCLSCRACATQCPIKVDVPSFKSRFLAAYHARYPRPLGDYALAALEPAAKRFARVPRLANAVAASRAGRAGLARFVGLSSAPAFSVPGLHRYLDAHPQYRFSYQRFRGLNPADRARTVFLVQDSFTSFFDAPVVVATVELLARLGYRPLVLPFKANGKALQVKGFLAEFQKTAARMGEFLQAVAALERPLVGIDPSVTLTYREEYPDALGGDRVPRVQLLEEWLAQGLETPEKPPADDKPPTHTLLQHCTAATVCPQSAAAWQRVFAHFGLSLAAAAVGCCGMSGAYGHETRHQRQSRGIFDLSWRDACRGATGKPAVPGYSCRSQIRRFGDVQPLHPTQILLEHCTPTHSI